MDADDLYLVPQAGLKCILWHLGHIAHKEEVHIGGLTPDAFDRVPPASHGGLSTGQWLSITLVHTGVHLGQIYTLKQLLGSRSA